MYLDLLTYTADISESSGHDNVWVDFSVVIIKGMGSLLVSPVSPNKSAFRFVLT